MPPFGRIRPEHFPPALGHAMAEQLEDVAAIAGGPAAPSFANTVEALERSGRLLDRVRSVFFDFAGGQASDPLQAIERDHAPRLARHRTEIALNPAPFRRVAALHDGRDGLELEPDRRRLLERLHSSLVRSGGALDPAGRARMAEIAARLAELHRLRPETAARRGRLADGAVRGESGWPARLPPRRGSGGGARAGPRGG